MDQLHRRGQAGKRESSSRNSRDWGCHYHCHYRNWQVSHPWCPGEEGERGCLEGEKGHQHQHQHQHSRGRSRGKALRKERATSQGKEERGGGVRSGVGVMHPPDPFSCLGLPPIQRLPIRGWFTPYSGLKVSQL